MGCDIFESVMGIKIDPTVSKINNVITFGEVAPLFLTEFARGLTGWRFSVNPEDAARDRAFDVSHKTRTLNAEGERWMGRS